MQYNCYLGNVLIRQDMGMRFSDDVITVGMGLLSRGNDDGVSTCYRDNRVSSITMTSAYI